MITSRIQQSTEIRTLTPPMVSELPKTIFADAKPSMSEIGRVDTLPPIRRVRARFSPASIRNIARVTMNEGRRVLKIGRASCRERVGDAASGGWRSDGL